MIIKLIYNYFLLISLISCKVFGESFSPVKHLRFAEPLESHDIETKQLEKICDHVSLSSTINLINLNQHLKEAQSYLTFDHH